MSTLLLKTLQRLLDEIRFGGVSKKTMEAADSLIAAASAERKIVQIAEGGIEGAQGRWDADAWTTALCNDGSVWRLHGGENGVWCRMPTVPQDAAQ